MLSFAFSSHASKIAIECTYANTAPYCDTLSLSWNGPEEFSDSAYERRRHIKASRSNGLGCRELLTIDFQHHACSSVSKNQGKGDDDLTSETK